MPTYTYECKNCGTKRHVIKSMRDYDRPEACPDRNCKDAEPMKRIIESAAPFHLKGRGWFKDGYSK